jgi:methionyl-tRNA synthetase
VEFQVNKLFETKQANQAREAALAAAAAGQSEVAAVTPAPAAVAEIAVAEEPELLPVKPVITYDNFSAMDIRIGTILEAERVKGSDKLLQLKVDTGVDVRIIVSGIAEHFEPQAVVGKQVTLLANLAPRKIRGIESQGMILLAEDNKGRLIFVVPEAGLQNGSVVR